jgi:hypothetical protein
MLASDVIARTQILMQDPTNVRWTSAELLLWISDAQREVVLYRPEANPTNGAITLTASQTKQSLPAGGIFLIDIIRNTTSGKAIRLVAREILDAQTPTWHADTSAADVKHYVYDKRDPKNFYVYPKPNGANQVDAIYSSIPADVASTGSTLALADTYMSMLVDYVLYRGYTKDAEYTGDAAKAVAHYSAFMAALKGFTTVESIYSPTANSALNPNYPGKTPAAA